MMNNTVIDIENAVVSYREDIALRGVSLRVSSGDFPELGDIYRICQTLGARDVEHYHPSALLRCLQMMMG